MPSNEILTSDLQLNAIFPKDIFGTIPLEVADLLKDSGFDSLVSLITLTKDDINQIESSRNVKTKLGHKRYIMQMADYANKAIGKKFDANKIQAAEANKLKMTQKHDLDETKECSAVRSETKRGLKRKFDRNENISLKKTTSKFCLDNKINNIAVPLIKIVRSEDNNVVCECGSDPVNVYPHSSKNNWVTSNYVRHLNRFHKPYSSGNKITNFLKPKSSEKIVEENAN